MVKPQGSPESGDPLTTPLPHAGLCLRHAPWWGPLCQVPSGLPRVRLGGGHLPPLQQFSCGDTLTLRGQCLEQFWCQRLEGDLLACRG